MRIVGALEYLTSDDVAAQPIRDGELDDSAAVLRWT